MRCITKLGFAQKILFNFTAPVVRQHKGVASHFRGEPMTAYYDHLRVFNQ